jgi:hypothetical protein
MHSSFVHMVTHTSFTDVHQWMYYMFLPTNLALINSTNLSLTPGCIRSLTISLCHVLMMAMQSSGRNEDQQTWARPRDIKQYPLYCVSGTSLFYSESFVTPLSPADTMSTCLSQFGVVGPTRTQRGPCTFLSQTSRCHTALWICLSIPNLTMCLDKSR